MENRPKFYITTAIPYASGIPHIGNTYEPVLTDSIARYKKLRGYDVFVCTGTDEHGQKVQRLAEAEGITPQEHADKITNEIKRIWNMMGFEYDYFIRTTDADHMKRIEGIFQKLYDQGDIYKKDYEGWYCTPCESFYTDSQIVEKDGQYVCPDCGAKLERSREEAYYFRLSKYGDRLLEYFEQNPDFVTPESRRNEMLNNFIKPGLQDFCVTRSTFDWGVRVPFDPKHVVYVWIDALSNYITALGYEPNGESGPLFKKYWPADLHVIGKDIVRFHTIYWPCMLMALGVELPKHVLGHPWYLFGADKMSKSKGNVIYADDFVRMFGREATRYYLLSQMAFAADSSVTYEQFISVFNTYLANILGNLVSRTVAMISKYNGGLVPERGETDELAKDLISVAEEAPKKYAALMDEYHVADAIEEIVTLLRRSNKYIDETMPWALAKSPENKAKLDSVLYNLAEAIRVAAVMLKPIMPDTSAAILAELGLAPGECDTWESLASFGALKPGLTVAPREPLFARVDETAKLKEINDYLEAKKGPKTVYEPLAPEITIDDFAKLDLRVATVTACEPVKKSTKLLKLQLDLGFEKRQVVSGIAKWYKPEDMVGRKVIVVANLKAAKLCGELSQGMIVAGDNADVEGAPETVILVPADENMTNGTKLH